MKHVQASKYINYLSKLMYVFLILEQENALLQLVSFKIMLTSDYDLRNGYIF